MYHYFWTFPAPVGSSVYSFFVSVLTDEGLVTAERLALEEVESRLSSFSKQDRKPILDALREAVPVIDQQSLAVVWVGESATAFSRGFKHDSD